MNSGQRIGLLVAAVAALVIGFFVLSPSDDKVDDTATTPATATETATASTPGETVTTAPKPPEPTYSVIRIAGGKPAGGVQTIKVKSGGRIRVEVRSADTTSEVHLHGYDVKRDLTAGGKVRFDVKADAEGIFEMELEETATPIAKIEVAP